MACRTTFIIAIAAAWTLFALVGLAMVVYGLGTALSIRLTRWGK